MTRSANRITRRDLNTLTVPPEWIVERYDPDFSICWDRPEDSPHPYPRIVLAHYQEGSFTKGWFTRCYLFRGRAFQGDLLKEEEHATKDDALRALPAYFTQVDEWIDIFLMSEVL